MARTCQSFRLYCRSPAPVPQTPKLVANSSLGLPLRIIAAALFLRCYGALFGRKTARLKKEEDDGDHYSSHRENERAGHQFDPHGTMLVGSAGM